MVREAKSAYIRYGPKLDTYLVTTTTQGENVVNCIKAYTLFSFFRFDPEIRIKGFKLI